LGKSSRKQKQQERVLQRWVGGVPAKVKIHDVRRRTPPMSDEFVATTVLRRRGSTNMMEE